MDPVLVDLFGWKFSESLLKNRDVLIFHLLIVILFIKPPWAIQWLQLMEKPIRYVKSHQFPLSSSILNF